MRILLVAVLSLVLPFPAAIARDVPLTAPPSGVLGVTDAELAPSYWIERAPQPDAVLMDAAAITAQNARLLQQDRSMHDLTALPAVLEHALVHSWIEPLSSRPEGTLYDEQGEKIDARTLDGLMDALALDTVPASQPTRFGLIVRRAALRSFPTELRVFSEPGDTDIDRFQESAIFPGTPVVIAHASRDGRWLFVVSQRYAAWVVGDAVAEGEREAVLGYAARSPSRVITGADVRTVYTPEQPALSQLELDMGLRLPLAEGLDPSKPVNGQTAYATWALDLPLRDADGKLAFAPALLQKNADSASDYLPLTRANILRQAFKFLGERYGWGHDYDGRDCSGFVSEIYRSMGVWMPRNTRDQSVSPGFEHQTFDPDSSAAERRAAIAMLDIGDLVYIPGHVMLVIGKAHGYHYVIHDVGSMSYRHADGTLRHIKLNAVSVTPLEPLMFNQKQSYIDRMTGVVRVHGRNQP